MDSIITKRSLITVLFWMFPVCNFWLLILSFGNKTSRDILIGLLITIVAIILWLMGWIKKIKIDNSSIYLYTLVRVRRIRLEQVKSVSIKNNRIELNMFKGEMIFIPLYGIDSKIKEKMLEYFLRI